MCVLQGRWLGKIKRTSFTSRLSKNHVYGRHPYEEMMQYTMLSDIGVSLDKPNNLNYEFSLPNKFFDHSSRYSSRSSHLIEIRKLVEQFNCGAMTIMIHMIF